MSGSFPHRMRDLVRLTGINAPTIHFYAQQGLLPEPHKTAGNQARYPEATVDRLLWIRALQTELRLPLRSIRDILEQHGPLAVDDIQALMALGHLLAEPDPAASAEDLSAVASRLAPGDVRALTRLGLIGTGGAASTSDVLLLELVAATRAAGFTDEAGFHIENIAVYRDAVERLVADELARIIEPVIARHDPETLRDLVRRGLPLADQVLSLLHRRAVQAELRRWLELELVESEPVTA